MTYIQLLLAVDPRTPPRKLEVVTLPETPVVGDAFEHGGRGYEVVGRGWNTNPGLAQVAIILRQIMGPPHIQVPGGLA